MALIILRIIFVDLLYLLAYSKYVPVSSLAVAQIIAIVLRLLSLKPKLLLLMNYHRNHLKIQTSTLTSCLVFHSDLLMDHASSMPQLCSEMVLLNYIVPVVP